MFSVLQPVGAELELPGRNAMYCTHWRVAMWQIYMSPGYFTYSKQVFFRTCMREYRGWLIERKLALAMAYDTRLGQNSPLQDLHDLRNIIAAFMDDCWDN